MNTDWIKKADIGICETDKRRTRMIYIRRNRVFLRFEQSFLT